MTEKKQDFNFPRYSYRHVRSAYIPRSVVIPAERGASDIVVKEGDTVFEGQKITADYKNTAPVHASIPGVVGAITRRTMPNGRQADCVIIDFRGGFEYGAEKNKEDPELYEQTAYRLIVQMRKNGIINTFDSDTAASLALHIEQAAERSGDGKKVLGVRLFDFDPGCFIDRFTASFFMREVFGGALLCARALKAEMLVFFYSGADFTPPSKSEADTWLEGYDYRFVKVDASLYPSGSDRALRKAAQKASDWTQKDEEITLFIDARTAYTVHKSLSAGTPVIDTLVEVNGPALYEHDVFKVRLGTPLRRLLEECGGCEKEPAKIVINGLIKGSAVRDLDIPVTKYVKTVSVLTTSDIPDQNVSRCIHCGFCRTVCPQGIQSDRIYGYYKNGTPLDADILLSARLCDECALCNTACPARLPLYQTVSRYKEKKDEKVL